MTGRQIDTTLVIRARDEATKAVTAIDAAWADLLATQKAVAAGSTNVATGIAKTVSALAAMDGAFAKANAATDQGVGAFTRQAGAVVALQSELAALQKQLAGATAAKDRFDKFIGPQTAEAQQRYSAVGVEIKNLERSIKSVERAAGQQDAQFQRSASTLAELGRQEKLVGAVTTFAAQEAAEYTKTLEQQATAAERAGTAAARAASVQAGAARFGDDSAFKSARFSAEVFRSAGPTKFEQNLAREAAAALDAETAAVARLRDELNPLIAIEARLASEQQKLNRWLREGTITAAEFAQAEKMLAAEAKRAAAETGRQANGKPTLFGLKPYELTNLGYQVNDIFTQLASGTSLTQTLAQQGGQLLQIFPQVGANIAAAFKNPIVLAFAATLGSIAIGLREVGNEAERIRQFGGLLSFNADGGDYNAKALNDASEALDRYGLSAEEAVAAVRIFIKEGVNPAAIESFGRTARNLADIMGIEVKEAAEGVAEAFTGSFDSIKKLDDAYNFLTAAQRESIRTMFEEGRASEARTEAYRIFDTKAEEVAQKSRGPWASAFRELGNAWNEFVGFLSDLTPIRAAAGALESLGRKVRELIADMRDGNSELVARNIAQQLKAIDEFRERIRANPGDLAAQWGLDAAQRQLALLRKEQASLNESRKDGVETRAQQAEASKKATEDLNREISAQKEKKTVEEAVTEARRKALETVEKEFRLADQATKNAYVNQKVEEARAAALKKAASERQREATAAKEAAREAERLAKQTTFQNPVNGSVSSGFGPRKSPGGIGSTFHRGIDFKVPIGTTVRAPADGVVVETGYDSKLGKFVYIDHGNKVISKLGHLSDNAVVQRGQVVRRGDDVGRSGNTGASTGPHLHWTVTVNGDAVDPTKGMFPLDGPGRFEVGLNDAISNADKLLDERNEKVDEFNRKQQQSNADMAVATIALREQLGLRDDALLAAQREQAVSKAEAELRERTARFNENLKPGQEPKILTSEEVDEVRDLAGAWFDASNARARYENQREAIDRPVNELSALRDGLQQRITYYQERGQTGLANQLEPQLDAVIAKLATAQNSAIAFYAALQPGTEQFPGTREELDLIIQRLQLAKVEGQNFGFFMGIAGQQIAQTFAGAATSAIDRFTQAVAEGENVFASVKAAFLSFAADFLRQIAQMILQQLIFNAISSALSGLGGGGATSAGGGSLGGGLGAFKLHSGGIATTGQQVAALPHWFVNAVRYHTGGIAGLAPDEVPAILQRNEEVLTEDDPRHRFNGGMTAEPVVNLKSINIFDAADMLQSALSSSRGERILLNWVRNNPAAFRGATGS